MLSADGYGLRAVRVPLFATFVATVMVATATAATGVDPRVCDLYNTHGAAAHAAYCESNAASLLVWKAVAAQVGAVSPFEPPCVATKKPFQQRCFLDHTQPTSGPAALVTWNKTTYVPAVAFGPAALAFVAAAKQRVGAAG